MTFKNVFHLAMKSNAIKSGGLKPPDLSFGLNYNTEKVFYYLKLG